MTMRNRFSTILYATIVLSGIVLMGGVVSSNAQANLSIGDESMHGAPDSHIPLTWDHDLDLPESPGWEQRFFGKPLSQYHVPKSKFRSASGPGFSLKAPGKLPGIEFNVEMHSLGALQSVVPPERMPKGLNSQQEQPLLLPPSNISPDYNAGFLRFTW